jgi:Flp pilus assembly protein TadD
LTSAVARVGQNDIASAQKHLFEIIDNNATDPDIYVLRAKLYFHLGDPFKASADFKTAKIIQSNHPEVGLLETRILEHVVELKNNAATEIRREDYLAAIWHLEKATELDDQDWRIHFMKFQRLTQRDIVGKDQHGRRWYK